MMKKKLTIITMAVCAAACLLGGISSAAAWFVRRTTVGDQDDLIGESQGAYFARGEGTYEKPFIINKPIHLYNLAWLQYIGYFNDSNAPYYFALDPEDGETQTTLDMDGWVLPPIGTSLYPFIGNFDGHGETIANLTIDNEVSSGHIERKPTFINNNSVANNVLKVYQKAEGVNPATYLNNTVDVVGFFGFLGSYSGMASVDANYAEANRVNDVALDELLVTSSSGHALGGLGVGYMNAPVSGMGISDSTITFANGAQPVSSITDNLSDFSTVGFASSSYRSSVSSYRTNAVVPSRSTSSGTGNEGGSERDWGGSIDFKEIFTRLDNIYDNRAKPYFRGVFSETTTSSITRSYVGGVRNDATASSSTTYTYYDGATSSNPANPGSNLLAFDSTHDKTNAYNPLEGKVAYHKVGSTNSTTAYDYQYLFGGKEGLSQFKKTQTIRTSIGGFQHQRFTIRGGKPEERTRNWTETHDTYTILVYGYGLNASGTSATTATSGSATTKWCVVDANNQDVALASANGSYVFTVINNKKYYLTGTLDQSVSLTDDIDDAITFTYTYDNYYEQYYLRPIVNGNQYYLYQSGNNIFIRSNRDRFTYNSSTRTTFTIIETYIGGFAFLNTDGSSISQGVGEEATHWVFSLRDEDKGRVFTTINGVDYYLNASTTNINVSTSATTIWSRSDTNVLSTVIEGVSYYLRWDEDNGFWMSSESGTAFTVDEVEDIEIETKSYNMYTLYNGRYLTATTDGIGSNRNSGTGLIFSNGLGQAGYIFFMSGSTPYYLYASSASAIGVTSTVSRASVWNVPNGSSGPISTIYNGVTYYLNYSNSYYSSSWSLSTTSQSITIASAGSINGEIFPTGTEQLVNNGVDIPETITPLVTSGVTSYAATEKNYGYIVSGSNSVSESNLMARNSIAESSDYGDIRIAKYPIGNIYNSITNGSSNDFGKVKTTSYCNGRNLGIIGRSYKSNGYVHITDEFDSGSNGVALPETTMSYEDMGLTKYKDSRGITNYQTQDSGLVKLLKGQTGVYGLHYVDGLVSPTNTCVAEKVLIDNEEISNFELPRDSIDFELHDSGFINFFAHTGYYNDGGPTNNSFFDLYEIDRVTADDKSSSAISGIKKIQTIYGKLDSGFIDVSIPYVYVYEDGTTSDANYKNATALSNNGYQSIFEMSWINDYSSGSELTQAWENFSVYYFEIPVNAGEYALGAVGGGQGAYLMYLDLGGNAMKYDYTNFTEYMKIVESSYQYPLGVAIIQNSGSGDSAVKDSVNAANSVALAILSAETVSFQKEGSIVTADYQTNATEVNFIGVNLIMKKSGQDPPVVAEGSIVKTTEYFRLTTVAYNVTLKRYEITELTKTVVTPVEGAVTTTYSGRMTIDNGVNWSTMTASDATNAINALNDGAGITDVSGNTNMVTFAAEVQYNENENLDPVNVQFLLTYIEVLSQDLNKYQEATGYAFTIVNPSTSNPLTATVIDVLEDEQGNMVYVISINGTTITASVKVVEVRPASVTP